MTDLQKKRRLALRVKLIKLLARNRVIAFEAMEEELESFIKNARAAEKDRIFMHYAAKLPFIVVTKIDWDKLIRTGKHFAEFLDNPLGNTEDYIDKIERLVKNNTGIIYGFL